MVVATGDSAAPASVVDESVHCLLEHPLLVADDNLRGGQLDEPLEPVVAVDDPAVEVVEVAGGEPAAVELHHGPELGREYRQSGQDHPIRPVAALSEGFYDPHTLDGLLPALTGCGLHLLLEFVAELIEVEVFEYVEDGLGAHAGAEDYAVAVAEVSVAALCQELADLEVFDLIDLVAHLFVKLVFLLFDFKLEVVYLGFQPVLGVIVVVFIRFIRIGMLAETGKLILEVGELGLALGLIPLKRLVKLLLKLIDAGCLELGIHRGDEVLREVEHPIQVAGRKVEQQAEPAGRALGEPDVGDGRGEGYVPHALAPYLGASHLDAAAVAGDALVSDLLVLAAVAFPVLGRSENALAEEAVLFGTQCAVVDGLRLGYLTVGPDSDLVW